MPPGNRESKNIRDALPIPTKRISTQTKIQMGA